MLVQIYFGTYHFAQLYLRANVLFASFDIRRLQLLGHKDSESTHSQLLVENLLELMLVVFNVFGLIFGEFAASIFIVKFEVRVHN